MNLNKVTDGLVRPIPKSKGQCLPICAVINQIGALMQEFMAMKSLIKWLNRQRCQIYPALPPFMQQLNKQIFQFLYLKSNQLSRIMFMFMGHVL